MGVVYENEHGQGEGTLNDTEFEIALKLVLPRAENDPMVLDAPLPTPDEILERVPSVEQLPRWEDGAPIPENRRAVENKRQQEIANEFGVWGMVVPCADQPHAVKLCLRGDLIRIEWSPCDDLFGALGLMAPCHQWVRKNQRAIAVALVKTLGKQPLEVIRGEQQLSRWLARRLFCDFEHYVPSEEYFKVVCALGDYDLWAQILLRGQGWLYNFTSHLYARASFEDLRHLLAALRRAVGGAENLRQKLSARIYGHELGDRLRRITSAVYQRELKGAVLLRYLERL